MGYKIWNEGNQKEKPPKIIILLKSKKKIKKHRQLRKMCTIIYQQTNKKACFFLLKYHPSLFLQTETIFQNQFHYPPFSKNKIPHENFCHSEINHASFLESCFLFYA